MIRCTIVMYGKSGLADSYNRSGGVYSNVQLRRLYYTFSSEIDMAASQENILGKKHFHYM